MASLSAKQGALESRYALPRAGDMHIFCEGTVVLQSHRSLSTLKYSSGSKSAENATARVAGGK